MIGFARLGPPVVLSLVTAAAAFGVSSDPFATPQGSVRLISGWLAAPPGADARLGLEFTLAPGWHVYWKNPGDAGYPPEFELSESSPVAVGEILYPAPQRFELAGGLVAFGYEERVVYPIEARLPETARGVVPIAGRLDYLVCAVSCIPYTAELGLGLPLGEAVDDPEIAPWIESWRARLPQSAEEVVDRVGATFVRGDGPELLLRLTFAGAGLRADRPDLFFDTHPLVSFDSPRFLDGANGQGFEIVLRPFDETRPLPDPLSVAWTAVGFRRDGRPLAFAGTQSLALPSAQLGSLARIALLALVLAAVSLLTLRWRRRNRIPDVQRR